MDMTKICLSFWSRKGGANRIRREEKEKKKKKKKRREEGRRNDQEEQRYGKIWIFVWKKSNHKPFFFFMNLGLKEPYLVYWWCLAVLD